MKRSLVILSFCAILSTGLTACGGGKSSNDNSAGNTTNTMSSTAPMEAASGAPAENGAVPNCGAVRAVWANTKTKVYHEPGDPMYGKTKHGEYLCPSQAKKEGYRPAGGAKNHSSM